MNGPRDDRNVFFLMPEWVDDDARVSGGNVYDRRIRDTLPSLGWRVEPILLDPARDTDAVRSLAALPDRAVLLIDGLLAEALPDVVAAETGRLTVLLLAHVPFDAVESARIVTTSDWTRNQLVNRGVSTPDRIIVARPGVDLPAAPRSLSSGGLRLLCLGAVAPHKGQDILVVGLAALADLPGWSCTIAGSTRVDPGFTASLVSLAADAGIADRVRFTGVLGGTELEAAFVTADLLVTPSREESYGMAVAEALARGIPVLVSDAGGLSEAAPNPDARLLVKADSASALAGALRKWCTDVALRERLSDAARADRGRARSWRTTAAEIAACLDAVISQPTGSPA